MVRVHSLLRRLESVRGNSQQERTTYMPGAFHERPLASETQAVDERLLQSKLGQGQDGNDVPSDSPMVFWVAARVWVEHAEAEQETQSAHSTHGCTLGGRMA